MISEKNSDPSFSSTRKGPAPSGLAAPNLAPAAEVLAPTAAAPATIENPIEKVAGSIRPGPLSVVMGNSAFLRSRAARRMKVAMTSAAISRVK